MLPLLLLMLAATPEPGPRTGDRIPAFALPDSTGATRTFESIRGPKGALLVFYRSADW